MNKADTVYARSFKAPSSLSGVRSPPTERFTYRSFAYEHSHIRVGITSCIGIVTSMDHVSRPTELAVENTTETSMLKTAPCNCCVIVNYY